MTAGLVHHIDITSRFHPKVRSGTHRHTVLAAAPDQHVRFALTRRRSKLHQGDDELVCAPEVDADRRLARAEVSSKRLVNPAVSGTAQRSRNGNQVPERSCDADVR
jgi:hypothetical protein